MSSSSSSSSSYRPAPLYKKCMICLDFNMWIRPYVLDTGACLFLCTDKGAPMRTTRHYNDCNLEYLQPKTWYVAKTAGAEDTKKRIICESYTELQQKLGEEPFVYRMYGCVLVFDPKDNDWTQGSRQAWLDRAPTDPSAKLFRFTDEPQYEGVQKEAGDVHHLSINWYMSPSRMYDRIRDPHRTPYLWDYAMQMRQRFHDPDGTLTKRVQERLAYHHAGVIQLLDLSLSREERRKKNKRKETEDEEEETNSKEQKTDQEEILD
jgi:hypothetical protein